MLWKRGPSTVHEIRADLRAERRVGYTTVLKLLQIMLEKGLVRRDEARRPHVYRARRSQEKTLDQLVRDLLQRAFDGSASKLVLQALAAQKPSREEIEEVKQLLERLMEEE